MPPPRSKSFSATLAPTDYPYNFTEIVSFKGDFDETVRPGEVVNPKGIAYHRGLDRLLVSLSPFNIDLGSRSQILNSISRDGARGRFSPGYQMYRAVESKIAVVPDSGPPLAAGFTPGEIFLGRGPLTEISRLSATGEVLNDVWVNLNEGTGIWGGLCFDTEGEFGGRLIAVESNGKIYLVNADGSFELLVDMVLRLEGVTVAPSTFGRFSKNIIVGCEGYGDNDPHGGEIFAIDKDLEIGMLANIGYAAEHLEFIPPMGGTYYQNQLAFDRERENRILCVSSSQLLTRGGRLIVVNEMTGELWEVATNGSGYTQQPVGSVPGRWSTSGFYVQGTELEAGCFAVKQPRLPQWSAWEALPGSFITDRAPAAAPNFKGELVVFGTDQSNRELFINTLGAGAVLNEAILSDPDTSNRPPDPVDPGDWDGWQPEPGGVSTEYAPACTLHNNRLYAFTVGSDGGINHKYYTTEDEQSPATFMDPGWEPVPGGMLTGTGVNCANVNGRLVVCVLSNDKKIFLNELAPGGRYWSGWYRVPGGGSTNVTPSVVSFQDELYVLIKGLSSNRILLKARSVDGNWTPWSELPGNGRTDAAVTSVAAGGQLYVFIKGTDRRQYLNVASETGTWSGWQALPDAKLSDIPVTSAATGDRLYVFSRSNQDQQLYVRTAV
ncbi:MAG: hypothetical protein IPJ07_07720 [Acidobacteria bacterium]|nr:hypothetical protein [Acidobacteriota bacterium]